MQLTVGQRILHYMKLNDVTFRELESKTGISKATLNRYANGSKLRMDKAERIADALGVTPADLLGWNEELPSNAIPNDPSGMRPVLGRIPAGEPALAINDIIGYEPVSVSDPDTTFWLRVTGDSMTGAGIMSGDYVLIRQQSWAENGQIVACRINGDEATLKRYSLQGDVVVLTPENSSYSPRVIPAKDFETGDAGIIGVAIEFKRKLI